MVTAIVSRNGDLSETSVPPTMSRCPVEPSGLERVTVLKVLSVEQMRALERAANESGLPYSRMMENAGSAVASWLLTQGVIGKRILVLVGPGNNGGDGLVAAWYLHRAGALVSVYTVGRDRQGDTNWNRVTEAGIPVVSYEEDRHNAKLRRLTERADWVIDAVLGIGVSRPFAGGLRSVLTTVAKALAKNSPLGVADYRSGFLPTPSTTPVCRPRVLAVDVPSGLHADTGQVDPATLHADVTVSIAYPKIGQFLFPAAGYVGETVVADIGIPAELATQAAANATTAADARSLLPQRPLDAHKGTFGRLLVVAGSPNYTGAAYLATTAAMRVGAGLVTLGISEQLYPILAGKLTEATFALLPSDMGALIPEAVQALNDELDRAAALLLGPGLGRDPKTVHFVAQLLGCCGGDRRPRLGFVRPATERGVQKSLPALVIDADGLTALESVPEWHRFLPPQSVLTPHPGEMARLLGVSIADVQANRPERARSAAKEWNVVVLLKGANSIVASPDGMVQINPFANPVLSTAGTGDVQAGIIAGLVAQGTKAFDAAVLGAYLLGLAGEMLSERLGDAGALANDLLELLPKAIRRLKGC